MRSVDRIGDRAVGELGIVALRERVEPGASISLLAAVGGFTVSTISRLRWVGPITAAWRSRAR
jgi:hypothetical protein